MVQIGTYNLIVRSILRHTKDSASSSITRWKSTALNRTPYLNVEHNLPPIFVRNGLSQKMDYYRGWAWQQSLLNRRLAFQRSQRLGSEYSDYIYDEDDECDQVLLFEHNPAYTLGRGANENNLIFLDSEPDGGASSRQKLSRKARGPESCRLSVDRLRTGCRHMSLREEVHSMGEFYEVLWHYAN